VAAGWLGQALGSPPADIQEEKVVAVTGDDNSGGPVPTESTGINGAASAEDQAADQVGTAESTEHIAESEDAAPAAPAPEDGQDGAEAGEDAPGAPDLEQESEIAADYIEGLLDVADLDGDIDMDVEGDRPVVSVVGATLTELVGPKGEVLEALQELTRLAVHRQTGTRSRIMLDVGGYRARRREELAELGRTAAEEVSQTGVPQRLEAMTPFERKVVHDAVAAAGLRSESEGEEPARRVVVLPAEDAVMEPTGGGQG
jgi:spoIIIJ-associated protein